MGPSSLATAQNLYAESVNPQWARLLDLLGMNVRYQRCEGCEIYAEDGTRYLDFLSGYCVHNTGHNHPYVVEALKQELDRSGPAMLQSHVPELAGELAQRLCALAGGGLTRAFFCSSGSEGVEAAIKFSRAVTRRDALLFCEGAFHGLTCGALSLMDNPFWSDGFGPMLSDTKAVPFNDLTALEAQLKSRKYASFFVEPIQSEAGIRVPSPNYLRDAQALCRRYGTLLVLDEVQTGMHRTGRFLAGQHFNVQPDIVVLAKALSGGLVPVGAVLMKEEICDAVYSTLQRAIVHTSTFSENGLAMRAGLATLDVLQDENLGDRAILLGEHLRVSLRAALGQYEMFAGTPGLGLLSGIEFRPPTKLALRLSLQAFRAIHPAMFGQVVVMRMFREQKILTQMCGNNSLVLKSAPPLVADEATIDAFVTAAERTVWEMHNSTAFWTEPLALARRAINA
ncbi:MAG TPA: aspartate aminotransferase family protein [Candidatus Angelobacter sp.]|nr:aspartate aminotransferase family protein [Candidatus Angelobacter sp.]